MFNPLSCWRHVASRTLGWRGLAFCVKREYFILLEFMKMMLNSSKHVKLVAKNHTFS